MTCVWTGLITALSADDVKLMELDRKPSPQQLVHFLKERNVKTVNMSWNGHRITDKQLDENYSAVDEFNPNTIGCGYDCSICDPFILLYAEIFRLNVEHQYLSNVMHYKHDSAVRTVKFASNQAHFWKQ